MILTQQDLLSLEDYHHQREVFREKVMAHKKKLRIHIGEHATFLFEDRLTVQYQIQEMLRIERIFEPNLIQEELDVYNPLISNKDNLKATLLLEYTPEERPQALADLRGIEHQGVLSIKDAGQSIAIANEDLERSNEQKTSAVHFIRFPLNHRMRKAIEQGKAIHLGFKHKAYPEQRQLTKDEQRCLQGLLPD